MNFILNKLTNENMTESPEAPRTKNIGINVNSEIANELKTRARSMDLSTGAYCKIILCEWIKSGKKLHLDER